MSKKIPNIIHLVWYGGNIPSQYQRHIINWRKLNPDFLIILWSCSETMTSDNFSQIERFCESQRIDLKNISDENILGKSLIQFSLVNQQWARASDITRYGALFRYGGYYFDTDLEPYTSLNVDQTSPSCGMYQYIDEKDIAQRLNIYFMAYVPKHPLLKATLAFMNEIHTLVLKTNYELWINTKDIRILPMVTADLTGSVLEHIFRGGGYSIEHVKYDLKNKVYIRCDGSWHRDFIEKGDDATLLEYIKFIKLRDSILHGSKRERELFEQAKYPNHLRDATFKALDMVGLFSRLASNQASLDYKILLESKKNNFPLPLYFDRAW